MGNNRHRWTVIRSYEDYSETTAYGIWTGVGTAGAAIVGMLFFEELKSGSHKHYILGVIFSIAGLKVVS